jgi:membrane protein required for colicin V production
MQTPPINTLNELDWFLIVILVVSTLMAFMKGIIRSLLSFVGLIVALLVASWEYLRFARYLSRWILKFQVAEVVAFLAILVGISLVFSLVAALLRRGASLIGLGFLDRLLGAGFGVLRGCLIGVALMMAVAAFFPKSSWVEDSELAPYFLEGAHAVSFVVPEHFEQQIADGATHLMQQSSESLKGRSSRRYRE